jgi:hypothetical protein
LRITDYDYEEVVQGAYPMDQFLRAVEFLGRKPTSQLYQEIIDKVYISSKYL